MKSIKYIVSMVILALTSVSCSDWDDHYDGSHVDNGSKLTLWEQIEANDQLSDFKEVLQNAKVFRHHKKTKVSYADLLNSGQTFTVMAPVNGTFNKDSLIALAATNVGDSVLERFFVKNHISRSLRSLNESDNTMLLLNSKHVSMKKDSIGNAAILTANNHTKNGVLHIMKEPLPYTNSIYEALNRNEDFSKIGEFLRQYNTDFFDEANSVSSGIVEGVPVYVDSVIVEYNKMLNVIGNIDAEDSTYWMIAPTSKGWEKAWDMATQYFKYDSKVMKRDSIQRYWTNRALLDDAIFNMNVQRSVKDSLTSVQYSQHDPLFHVFYKPYDNILKNVEPIKCSNGILYRTDDWAFTPEQTFFTRIKSEGEWTSNIVENHSCTYSSRRIVGDSISEGGALQIFPATATSNWDMSFRVNNTLSGTYDVCAVILPQTSIGQVATAARPCKFRATIIYTDEDGTEKSFDCGRVQFQNNPLRVDTVVLAEAFKFPTCNFDQNAIKVKVKLNCSILARETAKFSREMLLDCIYLRPRTPKSEKQ